MPREFNQILQELGCGNSKMTINIIKQRILHAEEQRQLFIFKHISNSYRYACLMAFKQEEVNLNEEMHDNDNHQIHENKNEGKSGGNQEAQIRLNTSK